MADIDFPVGLPIPRNLNISYAEVIANRSIGLAKGPNALTLWAEDNAVLYNVDWVLQEQEVRAFQGWYYNILLNGQEWFNMEIQWRGSNSDFTRVQECNFLNNPLNVSNRGKLRILSSSLIIRDPERI